MREAYKDEKDTWEAYRKNYDYYQQGENLYVSETTIIHMAEYRDEGAMKGWVVDEMSLQLMSDNFTVKGYR